MAAGNGLEAVGKLEVLAAAVNNSILNIRIGSI